MPYWLKILCTVSSLWFPLFWNKLKRDLDPNVSSVNIMLWLFNSFNLCWEYLFCCWSIFFIQLLNLQGRKNWPNVEFPYSPFSPLPTTVFTINILLWFMCSSWEDTTETSVVTVAQSELWVLFVLYPHVMAETHQYSVIQKSFTVLKIAHVLPTLLPPLILWQPLLKL